MHSSACICGKCMSRRGKFKTAIHLRFNNIIPEAENPETANDTPPASRMCRICNSKRPMTSGQPVTYYYCADCYNNLKTTKDEDSEAATRRRARKLEKYHANLSSIPFDPVSLLYAIYRFKDKVTLFPGVSTVKERKLALLSHFKHVLRIHLVDGMWMCCKNRWDEADLMKYLTICEGKYEEVSKQR